MDPHMTEEDREIYELGSHRRLRQELTPPACPQHIRKKKLVNFKVSLRRRSTKKEHQRRSSSGSIISNPPKPEGRKSSVTFLEDETGMMHTIRDSLEDVRPPPQGRNSPKTVPLERQDTKSLKERREAFRSTGEQRMAARRSQDRRSGSAVLNFSLSREQEEFRSVDLGDTDPMTLQRDDDLTKAAQHGLSIDSHRRTTPVDLATSPPRTRATSPRTSPMPRATSPRTSPMPRATSPRTSPIPRATPPRTSPLPRATPPPPPPPVLPTKAALVKQVSISESHQSIPPSPVKPQPRPPPQRLDSLDGFHPVHRRKSDFSRSSSLSSSENWNKIKTVATPRGSRMNSLVEMLITRRKASLAPSIWTPSVPRTPPGPRPANFQDQEERGRGAFVISFILHKPPAKQRPHLRFRRLPPMALPERETKGKQYLTWLSKLVANPLLSTGVLLKGLEIGVQFPVIHLRKIPPGGVPAGEQRRLEASLGTDCALFQGEYEEVVAWIPELLVTCPSDPSQWARCYIVLGFMTLDGELNPKMEKLWKEWTGALFVYCNIDDDLGLKKLSFYRRRSQHHAKLFSYIVVVEIDTVTKRNSINLLDFVYRMRLRSMSGYISVYQGHTADEEGDVNSTTTATSSAATASTTPAGMVTAPPIYSSCRSPSASSSSSPPSSFAAASASSSSSASSAQSEKTSFSTSAVIPEYYPDIPTPSANIGRMSV